MRRLKLTAIEYLLVSSGIIVGCVYISYELLPKAAFLWDESTFLYTAYQTYLALQKGNLATVSAILYNQFNYPPLQAGIIALFTSFTGFTLTNARHINVFFYFFTLLTTYVLTKMITPVYKQSAGTIALVFCLSSPLFYYFGTVSTKEMLGALLTNIFLITFLSKTNKLIPGVVLIFLFFTKYPYWIFVIIAIIIESIHGLIRKNPNKQVNYLFLLVPSVIVFWLWIILPGRINTFIYNTTNASINYTGDMAALADYLLFYPRSILFTYTFWPIMGAIISASYLYALRYLLNQRIRIPWLLFTINIVLVSSHWTNVQERYLFTTIPSLFAISSSILVHVITVASKKFHLKTKFVVSLATILFSLFTLLTLSRLSEAVSATSAKTMKGLTFDQQDYRDIWFTYNTSLWPKKIQTDSTNTMKYMLEKIRNEIDSAKPIQVIGFGNEWSMDYFNLMFQLAIRSHTEKHPEIANYIIVVLPALTSRYRTVDYDKINAWKEREAQQILTSTDYIILNKLTFEKQGMEVTILGVKE